MPTMLRIFLTLTMSALLCACAQVPKQTTYDYTTQHKMQAAHHWDLLAADVAGQIKEKLKERYLDLRGIYVTPSCGAPDTPCSPHEETPFGEGFHDLLITHLVNDGVRTMDKPSPSTLSVEYKAQWLYHKADRIERPYMGTFTLLATGAAVVRDAIVHDKAGPIYASGIGGAILLDSIAGSFTKGLPHSEIIVTITIKDDGQYVFRKSDIYYIHDEDFDHYENAAPLKTIPVIGE